MTDMNVLFVHGMGRSRLSWLPTAHYFKRRGLDCTTFAYQVSFQDVAAIVRRLIKTLTTMAGCGEYVVVGHSLGGVLLRAALANLPAATPLPARLFLLGSPVLSSRLARSLSGNPVFRMMTRDSGRLLGSGPGMRAIPASPVKTVAIIGTRGLRGRLSPFGEEPNDGVVAVSEASADWLDEVLYVPVVHTLLPSSRRVAELILERIDL